MIQTESSKKICAAVAFKICFVDLRRSSKTQGTPRASLRDQSKSSESRSSILAREFFLQWQIGHLPATFSGLYRSRSWRSIREAAAFKRTGHWKTGSRCFQKTGSSQLENVFRW